MPDRYKRIPENLHWNSTQMHDGNLAPHRKVQHGERHCCLLLLLLPLLLPVFGIVACCCCWHCCFLFLALLLVVGIVAYCCCCHCCFLFLHFCLMLLTTVGIGACCCWHLMTTFESCAFVKIHFLQIRNLQFCGVIPIVPNWF